MSQSRWHRGVRVRCRWPAPWFRTSENNTLRASLPAWRARLAARHFSLVAPAGRLRAGFEMFGYFNAEQRGPADHPLRPIRTVANEALRAMWRRMSGLYAKSGRALYSVRSERMLMEEQRHHFHPAKHLFHPLSPPRGSRGIPSGVEAPPRPRYRLLFAPRVRRCSCHRTHRPMLGTPAPPEARLCRRACWRRARRARWDKLG